MTGQTIAHYRITAKLGQGGMGAVYRAAKPNHDLETAIEISSEWTIVSGTRGTPPGFGVRQPSGAFERIGGSQSGRGLPPSKTLPRHN